jgi:phosphoribosylaminoimidazole-succinocarboxamide synthase
MADPVKGSKLYEGKAKVMYETGDPARLIQFFKDDATAFNAQKKGTIESKGVCNQRISAILYEYLEKQGIPTHFVRTLNERDMLVKRCKIAKIEFIVRNRVAGSLAQRLGIEEGRPLVKPMVETCYKNDALGDPFVSDEHIALLGLIDQTSLDLLKGYCLRINDLLVQFFDRLGVILVDFKLEFGLDAGGKWVLADEISPDTCRFWDKETLQKLDKDRFRRDLGGVSAAYQEMLKRVEGYAVS